MTNKRMQNKLKRYLKIYAANEHFLGDVCELIGAMEPIDLALLHLTNYKSSLDYLIARTSTDLMFETGYLLSVLGRAPYSQAYEFGLTDKDIESYQNKWTAAGVDPLTAEA